MVFALADFHYHISIKKQKIHEQTVQIIYMFQSVIVKNTFASIASVVVVVESPPPPPSRRLRALSRPRRRCRPCCDVVSSHPFGMLFIYSDRSKRSCNQGKEVL